MSSIYIWSENYVAESEAKDGGIWRAIVRQPQSLSIVFTARPTQIPTKLREEWAEISCFLYNLYNNILVLWTDNLVSDVMLVQKLYLAG